ncbi:MAG: DUF4405 domain-containing protein [Candidatus Latescibacteria bacterium]|nr:DUF4405 domain-containing protein [Candidatus Latescibacterota bacterium]
MGKTPRSSNCTRLYVDVGLFALFLVVSAPQATGVPIHEWISFAFIPLLIAHLLMSWKWIVRTTTRMFSSIPGKTRFNHTWDMILFVMMTVVIFSGIVVSEVALPAIGIPIIPDLFWLSMHDITSNLFLMMLGVHLAMHWPWLVQMAKRHILRKPIQSTSFGLQGDKAA